LVELSEQFYFSWRRPAPHITLGIKLRSLSKYLCRKAQ
jgi:hypothetical protein